MRSPTQKLIEKVARGERVTPAEKRHLLAWVDGRRRSDPAAKWIQRSLDVRALKTE